MPILAANGSNLQGKRVAHPHPVAVPGG